MKIKEMKKLLPKVTEVVMFEQWLRFYFIEEQDDGTLMVRIPEDEMKLIEQEHEHLYGLAAMMNDEEITYEQSCTNVCSYIASRLDAPGINPNTVPSLLDSKIFKIENYLFNVWLKGHESLLDAEKKPFSAWSGMFAEWLQTDEVKKYRKELEKSKSTSEATIQSSSVQ